MKYYYPQSSQILKLIQRSKNILINIHKNPDLDSFAAAFSMNRLIESFGKSVVIISPQPVKKFTDFFIDFDKIKVIDFSQFNFSRLDLLLILDSSSFDRVTGDKQIALPKISYFVIDHHEGNRFEKENKLVDTSASAAAEIIYKLFLDWRVKIDRQTATMLLAGILGDTVCLKYPKNPQKAMAVLAELLGKGADYQQIIDQVYDQMELPFVKLIGKFLEGMAVEKTKSGRRFVWSAVSYEQYRQFGKMKGAREAAADMFFRSIRGVDFGMAIVEAAPGKLEISFRSKPGVDVSLIGRSFGGGGHRQAAGATIEGNFYTVVKKVVNMIKCTTYESRDR